MIERLVALHDHDHASERTVLREWPLEVLLLQLLADAQLGDAHVGAPSESARVLLEAIKVRRPAAPPGSIEVFPALMGWQTCFDCRYAQAQQSFRFARLTLSTAVAALAHAGQQASKSSSMLGTSAGRTSMLPPPEGQILEPLLMQELEWPWNGKCPKSVAMTDALVSARRHLTSARKLYDGEVAWMANWQRKHESPSWELEQQEEWCLILRCGRLGASVLLVATWRLLRLAAQKQDTEAAAAGKESRVILVEVMRELSALLELPTATPRLRRMLRAESARLQAWRERWPPERA